MHHFLIAEPNETMLRTLTDALNCVDIGIILLNRDLRVRFINDRQIELFHLPPALLATGPHFRDLVAFAAHNGRFEMPSEEMEEFIAQRVDAVRAVSSGRPGSRSGMKSASSSAASPAPMEAGS